jgi:hypothetical protein
MLHSLCSAQSALRKRNSMSKKIARKLTLALTMLALAPAALAIPTGGDPEPMTVGIVTVVLSLLGLA